MPDRTLAPAVEPIVTAEPAGAVDAAKVVTSVVQAVESQADIPPNRAAAVITDILAGLYQAQPAIFAVTRASPRTQVQAALGLGVAQLVVSALLRRPS